ncbi:MAG TPA: aspartyl protease family protein [Steroidobacteraceae bacterium]|nr:aspartyl protease family protein [Steroidobacteraceae bacterium]
MTIGNGCRRRLSIIATSAAVLGTAALSSVAAFGACQLGEIAQLPVTMVGLRPTIPVRINGVDATFTVDSGSFYSMMTPAAAAQFHLTQRAGPSNLRINGIGGSMNFTVATVSDFALGPADLRRMDIIVGGSTFGGGAQGLLGQNILDSEDVDYDLASGAIRLMRPQGCQKTALAYWDKNKPYSLVEMESGQPLSGTRSIAYVNGRKILVQFDTGDPLSVLSIRAAKRAGFRTTAPGVVSGGFSYGVGPGVVATWIAPFESFRLGDEEIRNTRLRVADFDLGDVDMLIGTDFFLAHHIYVANSQHKIYFTYNGGPVFDLTAYQRLPAQRAPAQPPPAIAAQAPNDTGQTPSDAAGFARRGAALDARGEVALAIAELTHALALDPTNAQYFQQRARYELSARQLQPTMADLDRALQLKADDVPALLLRAQLRIRNGDRRGAAEDAATIDRVAPKQADSRADLAQVYMQIDEWDAAASQFSLWLASHPHDIGLARALNDRARARALGGTQLRAALNDCNAAIRLSLTKAARGAALDTRGLVRLRLGDFAASARDYDAALNIAGDRPTSLYGRGIDEIRQGRLDVGQADLRAATVLRANIAELFRRAGIAP